jgi:hypothetical protein
VSPLYLYGVTRPRSLPRRLSALGVSLVRSGDRAAIVSPVGSSLAESTKPSPRAHADVVEELHHGGVVLPARVGTVLSDRAAALALLAADETGSLLEAHRDSAELTLTAFYDKGAVLELMDGLGRVRDAASVLTTLEPLVLELRVDEPEGEHCALNLALLVERGRVDTVSEALEGLAASLSRSLRFELAGPLPPYSFVDLALPVTASWR